MNLVEMYAFLERIKLLEARDLVLEEKIKKLEERIQKLER